MKQKGALISKVKDTDNHKMQKALLLIKSY